MPNGLPNDFDSILKAAEALEAVVQSHRREIDELRRLPDPLVDSMRAAGIFRMAMPRDRGGPELLPVQQVRLLETLFRIDGSVGWCGLIGCDGGYFQAIVDTNLRDTLFPKLDTITAGQFIPKGRAEVVDGGYRVSGRWSFGSGCWHADFMLGACMEFRNGEAVRTESGLPQIRVLALPRGEVRIIETWDTLGMRGSGSHDYVVDDVFVPERHQLDVARRDRHPGPLYRYPFMFLCKHAGVLGIGTAALDQLRAFGEGRVTTVAASGLRNDVVVQGVLGRAEARLAAARHYVYATLDDCFTALERGDPLRKDQIAHFRLCLVHAHEATREVVTSVFDTLATKAIHKDHPLERQLRDVITACQHIAVNTRVYEPAGRLLWGLPAGPGGVGF
jgi:alkylation response protein AidB-like acyl-CoA dehydrogenase